MTTRAERVIERAAKAAGYSIACIGPGCDFDDDEGKCSHLCRELATRHARTVVVAALTEIQDGGLITSDGTLSTLLAELRGEKEIG